jgi:hypothetical protein
MNAFLAEMYNTWQNIGGAPDSSDLEKAAEAQLIDERLVKQGVDIDSLDGDTILKLAQDMFGANSALVKAAAEEPTAAHEESETAEEEKKEEAAKEEEHEEEVKKAALAELRAAQGQQAEETLEEKMAQADFLGRQMAHSYVDEMNQIEKSAAMPEALKKGLEAAKGGASKAFGAAKGHASEAAAKAKEVGSRASAFGKGKAESAKGFVHSHKGHIAAGAGGAAAGGIAGFAAGHKSKSASAIDALAEKRAMEWAQAHGLLEPSDEEKLAAVVDQRAVELLMQAGVDVAAVEAAEKG